MPPARPKSAASTATASPRSTSPSTTTTTTRPPSASRALDLPRRIAELAADLPRTTARAPSSARPRTAPPPSLTGHVILGVDPAPASPPRHAASAMHQVQGGGPCSTVPIRVSDEAMALWERQLIDAKHRSDLPLASKGLRDLRLPGVLILDHQLRAAKDLMLTKIDRYPEIFADANDTMILTHLFLDQLLAPLTLFMAAVRLVSAIYFSLPGKLTEKHQVLPSPEATYDLPASLRAVLDEDLDQAPLTLQSARRFFDATVRLYQQFTHLTHYLRTFDQHLTSLASTMETLEEEHALYMQVLSQHSVAVDRIQVLTLSRTVTTFRGTRLRVSVLDTASSRNTLNADDMGPHVSFAPDADAPAAAIATAPLPSALAVTTTNPAPGTHRKSVSSPPTTTTSTTTITTTGTRPTTAAATRKPATATTAAAPAGGSNSTLANGKLTSTAAGPDVPFPRVESRASQTAAIATDDAGKRGERRKTVVAVAPLGGTVPGGKALAAATAAALAAQEAEDASAAQAAADARAAEDQVRRMQADLQAAETEVAHCREKLDAANHALHQLRSDQHALHALLATSQAALTSLSAQNAELSATVVAVQRERDALLTAKADLARLLDDQRRANTVLVTAHDEGKRDLANARAQTCRAKEEAGAKDVKLKQACAEVERVQRTCRAHERHIAALEAQLEAAQASVQILAKVPDVDTAGLSAAAGSVGADDADHVVEEAIAANNARIAALERKNDELRQWRLREVALHRPATARVLSSHPALALAASTGGGVHLSMHGVEPMAADRGTDPLGRAASGAARVLAASASSVDRLYGKTARARASVNGVPEQANRGTGTARWATFAPTRCPAVPFDFRTRNRSPPGPRMAISAGGLFALFNLSADMPAPGAAGFAPNGDADGNGSVAPVPVEPLSPAPLAAAQPEPRQHADTPRPSEPRPPPTPSAAASPAPHPRHSDTYRSTPPTIPATLESTVSPAASRAAPASRPLVITIDDSDSDPDGPVRPTSTPTPAARAPAARAAAAAGAVPVNDDDDDDDDVIIISPPASPTRRAPRLPRAAAPAPPPVAAPGEGRRNKRSREARRAAAAAAGEVDDDDDDEIELVAVRRRPPPPAAAAATAATVATTPAAQRAAAAYRDLYRHMEEQNRQYGVATATLAPPPRVLPRITRPAGMRVPGAAIAHLSAAVPAAPAAPESAPPARRGECAVCMDAYTHPVSTMCGHIFCRACLEASLKRTKACPICRTTVKKNGYHPIFLP
ncbi:hypothetical protein GGF31_004907 [Allomyces arbusculus]|nr:hypothetical protein GGF31_004907 [Allomyces arbusculus]